MTYLGLGQHTEESCSGANHAVSQSQLGAIRTAAGTSDKPLTILEA